MTAEFIRDRLFQPFGTTRREGSGIGAFQARELLREGGGDVQAISAPGLGTTMRLVLPRTDVPDIVAKGADAFETRRAAGPPGEARGLMLADLRSAPS